MSVFEVEYFIIRVGESMYRWRRWQYQVTIVIWM